MNTQTVTEDKLTPMVTQKVVGELSDFFKTEAGQGVLNASYAGHISVGRDILGQEYFLNGGALSVARTQGGLDNLIEDAQPDAAPTLREQHPTLYTAGKVAASLLLAAGVLVSGGCGDGGGNGTTGPITGMTVLTAPLQIDMGDYVTVDGASVNSLNEWHETADALWSGNNGDDFYPDLGFAGKQAMKFFASNDDTTQSLDYHIIVKYNLESAEEQDSPADFATNPDLIPEADWNGFWKTKVSAGAQVELAAILALYNPSDLDEHAWGVNADGVYVQLNIINESEVAGYTDNTGDAMPDYVARITPASFPTLTQGTVDELNALINAPPADAAAAIQFIDDFMTYRVPTVILDGPFAQYYLFSTGNPVHVDTQAMYTVNGNPVSTMFVYNPSAQELIDINAENSAPYSGEEPVAILPIDTGKQIADFADIAHDDHVTNNP